MASLPVRRPRIDYRRELAAFLDRPGPFLSMYLDVRPGAARDTARQRLFQALEDEPRAEGSAVDLWSTAGSALELLDVDDATLVSFVSADGESLTTGYPEPPRTDFIGVAGLPRLGPMLRAEQSLIHHVVAIYENESFGIATIPRHGEPVDARYEAQDRGAVEALIQHTARTSETRLLLVCAADEDLSWLVSHVQAGLPATTAVQGIATDGINDAELSAELVVAASNHAAEKTVELIRLWRFHHAHGEALAGAAALDAMRTGQAALILLNDDFDDDREILYSPLTDQPGFDGRSDADQAQMLVQARVADVIIMTALTFDCPIHIVPDLGDTLEGGFGVILSEHADADGLAALLEG